MNFSDSGTDRDWRFIHFGLIVTGKTVFRISFGSCKQPECAPSE